ncbi:NhaP-type Na+/H+ and K+/H+ antiporter [Clostridium tetanomorphum]|uniref:Uncharacterized protein n=1 Tax=Clostridium tetanomorphum TaxID=1553 RepID=A0A923E536_CLOTT|nr:hypothetical protein [Clostridium tetanomorphum]KAJ51492.1 hypothetical protein CTM_12920 [Clostridium tetanomorphum DSM 665]MBC2396585.1 hypothetical protein [Clostridium tetanomorphum]MBP1863913.1 NhaP-type Na+/H+ and K+/H+ antiporter [Clostridium tetanomorphum]NRS84991.1 NhaP-type Na+/H+ and K+/H+ antiporter [Clostridium tetanomorphum]NRZ98207.1 NhaP-type Na+/H+ and K+/H+ antiporter [Clostridium tetanomorphum]
MENKNYLLLLSISIVFLIISVLANHNVYAKLKKQKYIDNEIKIAYDSLFQKQVKKCTYSDIIRLVEENKNFSIININKEKNNDIKVELKFRGNLNTCINFIKRIKEKVEFKEIIYLTIEKDDQDIKGTFKFSLKEN